MAGGELVENGRGVVSDLAEGARGGLTEFLGLVGEAAEVDLEGLDVGDVGEGEGGLEAGVVLVGEFDQRGDGLSVVEGGLGLDDGLADGEVGVGGLARRAGAAFSGSPIWPRAEAAWRGRVRRGYRGL